LDSRTCLLLGCFAGGEVIAGTEGDAPAVFIRAAAPAVSS
jgi:hypothetical protein